MRLVPIACLLAALCLPGAVQAQSLLEVYAQARASDPTLALVDAQRGVQHEVAAQTRANLLPQWSLNASSSKLSSTGQQGNQVSSNLSQVLIDIGQLRQVQVANTLASAQDVTVRAAEQALCARVATAYFGVLSAQAALQTAQANEDAFAQQVDQAQKRYDAGLSAMIDVEQARTYLALARGTTVQAAEALQDARQALAQITGLVPGDLLPLATQLTAAPLAPQDPQAWVAQALQNNPSLLAQQLQLDASEQGIGAARAGHLPTLGLSLDSQRLGGDTDPTVDTGRFNNALTLRLTVPLFAGGATQAQTRQALHLRDVAFQTLEAAKRSVARETQAQYRAVLSSAALMQTGEAAVLAADKALAATRAGQALGTRTMTDLLLAIQTQAAAQNALAQARHRYVLSMLLLQQAVGALDERALTQANHMLQGS